LTTNSDYKLTSQRLVSGYIVSQLSNRMHFSEMSYEDMECRTSPVDVLEFNVTRANPRERIDAVTLRGYIGGNFSQVSPEGNVFEGIIRRQKVIIEIN